MKLHQGTEGNIHERKEWHSVKDIAQLNFKLNFK